MKRLITLILIVALVLSISASAFASSGQEDEVIIKEVVLVIDNVSYDLHPNNYEAEAQKIFKEIAAEKNKEKEIVTIDLIEPFGMTDDWYRYDEDTYWEESDINLGEIYGSALYNDTSINQVKIIEGGVSYSWGINLTGDYSFSVLSTGAGFSFQQTETFREGVELTIAPKKWGWVEIAPVRTYTQGDYKTFSWLGDLKNSESVIAWSPTAIFYITKESANSPY